MHQKITYLKTLLAFILKPSKSWLGFISNAKANLNNKLMVIPCWLSNNLRIVFSSQWAAFEKASLLPWNFSKNREYILLISSNCIESSSLCMKQRKTTNGKEILIQHGFLAENIYICFYMINKFRLRIR